MVLLLWVNIFPNNFLLLIQFSLDPPEAFWDFFDIFGGVRGVPPFTSELRLAVSSWGSLKMTGLSLQFTYGSKCRHCESAKISCTLSVSAFTPMHSYLHTHRGNNKKILPVEGKKGGVTPSPFKNQKSSKRASRGSQEYGISFIKFLPLQGKKWGYPLAPPIK